MKKIIFFLGAIFLFSGCGNNSDTKKPENSEKNVENSIQISEKKMKMPQDFSAMDADVFAKLMKSEQYTVIDIRTPQEIAQGKILKNALEIDYYAENFLEKLQKLDTTKKYLIYCRSGARSGRTLRGMQQMGFQTAYDLKGGISAWTRAGKKLNQ